MKADSPQKDESKIDSLPGKDRSPARPERFSGSGPGLRIGRLPEKHSGRAGDASLPTELELQQIWFEQWYPRRLKTDDGQTIELIQPGLWNHGAGPDFHQAALRLPDGTLRVGAVEVHLQAEDWHRHGHHDDPAYDETILHVVWESQEYHPATSQFQRIPQVVLRDQLSIPWTQLQETLESSSSARSALAHPGLCHQEMKFYSAERIAEVLETAGWYRWRLKNRRFSGRIATVGWHQTVWEALAESCGYHQNKIPFRLLAQRLPFRVLAPRKLRERQALLFGVAGWLPSSEWERLPTESKKEVHTLWAEWWKERSHYIHTILPHSLWRFSGLRPVNRPERRLAALAVISGKIPELVQAIRIGDEKHFSTILKKIKNPFWESHFTWNSHQKPIQLLGEQRIQEILINVFWPMAGIHFPEEAKKGLGQIRWGSNHATRIAHQRVLGGTSLGNSRKSALVQQGLIQIYREFCQQDATECLDCPFPVMVRNRVRVEEADEYPRQRQSVKI